MLQLLLVLISCKWIWCVLLLLLLLLLLLKLLLLLLLLLLQVLQQGICGDKGVRVWVEHVLRCRQLTLGLHGRHSH